MEVTSTRCGPTTGATLNADGSTVCRTCPAGSISDTTSFAPCEACPVGTATSSDGGIACDWCAPGYGWDDDDGACLLCTEATYSSGISYHEPCEVCDAGLTTSYDGAGACSQVVVGVTSQGGTTAVIAVAIFFAVAGLVALAVSCCHSPRARHVVIFTTLMSLFDVVTDYLFALSLVEAQRRSLSDKIPTLLTVSIGSILVAFIVNSLFTAFVLLRERRRPVFRKWLRENTAAVAAASVISATNASVLSVLSSGLFDVNATRAPFSGGTLDIISLGGIAAVLLEDLPQLVVSISYLAVGGGGLVVYFSIFASAVGVLTGFFLRLVICCVIADDGDPSGSPADISTDDGGRVGRMSVALDTYDNAQGASGEAGGKGAEISTGNPVFEPM